MIYFILNLDFSIKSFRDSPSAPKPELIARSALNSESANEKPGGKPKSGDGVRFEERTDA